MNRVSAGEPAAPSCPVVPKRSRRSGIRMTTVMPSSSEARNEVSMPSEELRAVGPHLPEQTEFGLHA